MKQLGATGLRFQIGDLGRDFAMKNRDGTSIFVEKNRKLELHDRIWNFDACPERAK